MGDADMIDVVIAWVDGDDPSHKAKRRMYMPSEMSQSDDIGGSTRFASRGEILFCVGSVLRFAPFVHKVYIVTDSQRPDLDAFLHKNFPDNRIPIEIVDHKVLFRGYEQYLPTFNSLSIETMLYRVPGLEERFIYFNDDFFITSPLREDDWFDADGKAVCYGHKFSSAFARLLRRLKPARNGHKPFGYKDAMLNAADVAGSPYFWYIPHAPIPLLRSWYVDFYERHPEMLEANIRYRFRNPVQFNPQVLFYILAGREGRCVIRSAKGLVEFFKPKPEKKGYMAKKLAEADSRDRLLFACINSLDKASESDYELFKAWVSSRLDVKF